MSVIKFGLKEYIKYNLFGIDESTDSLDAIPPKSTFELFQIPVQLESVIFLGFFVCLDSLLYMFAFFPVRLLISIFYLIWYVHEQVFLLLKQTLYFFGNNADKEQSKVFNRTRLFDILKGIMVILGLLVLQQINMSKAYHYIRGQNMVKLYALASMLEVVDKLLTTFGQDIFDVLTINMRKTLYDWNWMIAFGVSTIYVILHSLFYYLQITTLTVIVNSSDETLFTVLILNNFAELRSFVFKKYDMKNLFQLCCADITERFQMLLFLCIILCFEISKFPTSWIDLCHNFARIIGLMICWEIVTDSMKHMFIDKFNCLNPHLYRQYRKHLQVLMTGYNVLHIPPSPMKSSQNAVSPVSQRQEGEKIELLPTTSKRQVLQDITKKLTFQDAVQAEKENKENRNVTNTLPPSGKKLSKKNKHKHMKEDDQTMVRMVSNAMNKSANTSEDLRNRLFSPFKTQNADSFSFSENTVTVHSTASTTSAPGIAEHSLSLDASKVSSESSSIYNTMRIDYIDVLTRKIGLSQVPLACVTLRYVWLIGAAPSTQSLLVIYPYEQTIMAIIMIFGILLCLKIVVGWVLIVYSQNGCKQITPEDEKTSKALEEVNRFTVLNGKVI